MCPELIRQITNIMEYPTSKTINIASLLAQSKQNYEQLSIVDSSEFESSCRSIEMISNAGSLQGRGSRTSNYPRLLEKRDRHKGEDRVLAQTDKKNRPKAEGPAYVDISKMHQAKNREIAAYREQIIRLQGLLSQKPKICQSCLNLKDSLQAINTKCSDIQAQNMSLKSQLNELSLKQSALGHQKQALLHKNSALMNQIQQITLNFATYKHEHGSAREEQERLQRQNQSLVQQQQNSRDGMLSLEEKLGEYTRKFNELQSQHTSLFMENFDLRQKLEKAFFNLKQLESKIHHLEKARHEEGRVHQERQEFWREKYARATPAPNDWEGKMKPTEVSDYAASLADLEQRCSKLEYETDLNRQMEQKINEIAALEAKLATVRQQLQSTRQQSQQIALRCGRMQQSLRQYERHSKKCAQQTQQANQKIAELIKTKSQQQASRIRREEYISELQSKSQKLIEENQRLVVVLGSQKERFQQLISQNQTHELQLNQLQQKHRQAAFVLQKQVESLNSQLFTLIKQLSCKNQGIIKAQQQQQQSQKAGEALLSEISCLQLALKQKQSCYKVLLQNYSKAVKEQQRLTYSLNQSGRTLQQSQKQFQQAFKRQASLRGDMDLLQARIGQLVESRNHEVLKLELKINDLTVAKTTQQQELEAKYKNQIASLEQCIENMKKAEEVLFINYESQLQKGVAREKALKDLRAQLEKQRKENQITINCSEQKQRILVQLQNELASLVNQKLMLQNNLKQRNQLYEALEKQKNKVDKQLAQSQSHLHLQSTLKLQLATTLEGLEANFTAYKQQYDDAYFKYKLEHEESIKFFTEELAIWSEKYSQVKQDNQVLQLELQSLKAIQKISEQQINRLNAAMSKNAQQQIKQLARQLQAQKKESAIIREQNRVLETTLHTQLHKRKEIIEQLLEEKNTLYEQIRNGLSN